MQVIAFIFLQLCIIPKQLIQATAKGKQHQSIDKEELDNIDNHASQRNLQWSQMRIDREDVNQFQIGKDHSRSKSAF